MRLVSTTVPAGIRALPFGNTVYVPGLTASTTTALPSVTPDRSSNVTALVAFSSAFSATDGGGEERVMTLPLELDMSAPATAIVDAAMMTAPHTAKSAFEERICPTSFVARPRSCSGP